MLANVLLYSAIALAAFFGFIMINPSVKRYVTKIKLENQFMDFLALLLIMESAGLRLDTVFEEARKGNLVLPSSYHIVVEKYSLLSKVTSDPYTCIRKLAEHVPSARIAGFLKSYSDILVSTGDTLNFVNSYVKEEFQGLKTRIEEYARILDNLFEAYLIIVLGILVYSVLPLAPIPPVITAILLSMVSVIALSIAFRLLDLAALYLDLIVYGLTVSIAALTPAVVLFPDYVFVHCIITILIGFTLWCTMGYVYSLEQRFVTLLEDLYGEARQGIPLDMAIIKISGRYGYPVTRIADLLRLGFKPREVINAVSLPPLPRRILDLVLSPIMYSKGYSGYLGYILEVVDGIRALRRMLIERSKVYTVYVVLMLVVVTILSKLFIGIGGGITDSLDLSMIRALVYASVVEASLISSIIGKGYWFRGLLFYVLVPLSAIVCYTGFSL